jgi:hypothetical protein
MSSEVLNFDGNVEFLKDLYTRFLSGVPEDERDALAQTTILPYILGQVSLFYDGHSHDMNTHCWLVIPNGLMDHEDDYIYVTSLVAIAPKIC